MDKLYVSSGRYGLKAKIAMIATTVTLTASAAIIPLAALADHTTAHTIEQLTAQIEVLKTQLAALAGVPTPAPAGVPTPAPASGGVKCTFTRSLFQGVSGDDVKCLQMVLNSAGYTIALSGAGSPGNETMFFGGLTKAAVAKWQAAAGVSPAAGYFGPLSRAKYDSMVVAVAPTPAPTPTPTPTPTPGATPPVAVPAGSGLTVTAPAEQPLAKLVPEGSARVPFVKAVFTASSDGNATVKSVTVERKGAGDDAAYDSIILLDEDGTQIGGSKTLSSDHKVVLNESLVVNAGTSKTVTVAGNMIASLDNYAGQIPRLAIIAVDAGTSKVNAAFPIEGNGMTLNSTLAIGTVTMSLGSLDPGAANTKNVGTKAYYLASVKASIGSAEDVSFEQIRFNQAGSAATSDLENVMVKAADKEYPVTVSSDGKYFIVKFPGGLTAVKGGTVEFSIKADLVNGSARTVDMNLLKKADMVVGGKVYGNYITVGGGSSGAASAGGFSSNQEPFFNAYAATIDKGSMLITSSTVVPAANIPIDVSDTVLGAFIFDVKGEEMQTSSMTLNFTFTGTGTSSDITGVKLFDEAGTIVAGPKDPASGVVTWTDTWTAKVGAKNYTAKGKLDTSFVSDDTVRVGIDGDNVTTKGVITGLTVTVTPSTIIQANTQTVKAGNLKISVSPTPQAQNVVRGVSGFCLLYTSPSPRD